MRTMRLPRGHEVALLVALVVCVSSAGCVRSSTGGRTPVPATEATVTPRAVRYPTRSSLREAPSQKFTYRQLELPPGTEVTDYTDTLAAFSHNSPSNRHAVLGLMDLTSGRRRFVLRKAVNEALGYYPLAPRISNSWIAWEELSPNEDSDPQNVRWRLYAAPIDAKRLSIDTPQVVDSGVTNYKLRPHYVVLGSTVYWTANRIAGPHQEAFPPSGRIEALDLGTGRRRIVSSASTEIETLCAADSLLCLTESRTGTPRRSVTVQLIDPATGEVVLRRNLGNTQGLSHFVRASGDWLAWAVFPEGEASWPDLYLAGRPSSAEPTASSTSAPPVGDIIMAGAAAMDPAFFGGYVTYESIETSGRPNTPGGLQTLRRIRVANPEKGTQAVLLETRDDVRDTTGGWWQTCASGLRTDTMLLWNDLGPWLEDQSKARTLVRLYRPVE